jgi:hypothetical protein
MRLRTLPSRLIAAGLLPAILVACGGPPPPTIDTVTSLPGDRQLLLGAAVNNTDRDYELLLLKPGDPTLRAWQLQGGRGLTEDGSSCQSSEDAQVWDAASRTLTITGCFGDQGGLNIVSADGQVTNLARTILLPEMDPATQSSTQSILRDGAVELPSGVEYLKHFRRAHHSDTFAFTGYIWGGTVGDVQHYIYVVDPQNRVTTYGEAWDFEAIEHIRWAPDDSGLSFIGASRPDGEFYQRVYYLDLASGAVEELSDANVLIDSTVEFTSDGGVVFAGAGADEGAAPAIYFAAPGADATPLVSLDAIPQSESWRGKFLLSPDGARVAFVAERDNPATPWTLYSAELSSGAIRDLLPPALQVQRSGTTDGADSPYPQLLAWHPDGQEVVFGSSLTGHCNNFNAAGVVNCTQQVYAVPTDGGAPAYLSEAHLTTVGFAIWVE